MYASIRWSGKAVGHTTYIRVVKAILPNLSSGDDDEARGCCGTGAAVRAGVLFHLTIQLPTHHNPMKEG